MENYILVNIKGNEITVVNGNMRLRALLKIDGKATVRDIETGQDLLVTLNEAEEIIEYKDELKKTQQKKQPGYRKFEKNKRF